ncbi:MAG: hypothetical protein MZW92_50135 [Comamonadaceae bacterium]|nr:hypothetical protein [Comamonadaceae bacterium]
MLELILPRTRMITLDPGEVLIERGALNDFVYLILEGSLHVHLDDGQAPHFFALGPGHLRRRDLGHRRRWGDGKGGGGGAKPPAQHRRPDLVVPGGEYRRRRAQSAADLLRPDASRQRRCFWAVCASGRRSSGFPASTP